MILIAKRYNTPHRSRVVKTRMIEEEYADFAARLAPYEISQAEFIRQAITGAAIRPVVTVSQVNDELLSAIEQLTAEQGKIGGNLNQIARALNEHGAFYPHRLLTAGVTANLRKMTDYAAGHEKQFMKLLIEQNEDGGRRRNAAKKKELDAAEKRIAELSVIFKRLYEDNVTRKISDSRFMELSADYEQEQAGLQEHAAILQGGT